MSVESISPKLAKILPYTLIVGQERVKLALELAYIAPRIGGVLLSGQRGTAKSTAVRAFTRMMYDKLPVTLPINATEDRVVGGWRIDKLMQSKPEPQPGLLKDADESLLYIDEVNLLDDHIVNIILDVTSTGVLEVQRDGQNELHPRLRFDLSRFGLIFTQREEDIIRLEEQGILTHTVDEGKKIYSLSSSMMELWVIQELQQTDENWLQAREKVFLNLMSHQQLDEFTTAIKWLWNNKNYIPSNLEWFGNLVAAIQQIIES
jgi:hypothetical protein